MTTASTAPADAVPGTLANPPNPPDRPDRSDPSDNEIDMAARLRLSATRLARRLRQESDSGLTPTQLSALSVIDRHGPVSLGELAQHERVARPTVTRVVAKLEADGFVIRQAVPQDGRSARIALTTAGTDLLEQTRTRKDAWLAARIAGLHPEDQVRLDGALNILDRLTEDDEGQR
jgi:DNA-binding MarR family transcriptional regulator